MTHENEDESDREAAREAIAEEFSVPEEYVKRPMCASAYIDGYRDALEAIMGGEYPPASGPLSGLGPTATGTDADSRDDP